MRLKMNRGDIYWVDLDPTKGSEIKKLRPCVIISATSINKARHTVVVIPLSTSARARPPIVVGVQYLEKTVTAICDQIRTVDKMRLIKPAGGLSLKDLELLEDNLRLVLSL
jgi:mRNA interferase MazF